MLGLKWIEDISKKKRRTRVLRSDPMFEYEIYLKPGALDSIKKAKGYKNWTEFADDLKITKQYMSNLKTGRVGVSHSFIVRIAVLLNNISDKWWVYYEIRPTTRKLHINSKAFNKDKYEGKMPYAPFSPSGNERLKDGTIEFQAI